MNPILPPQYFIPDVEARAWKDGRLYLYGSADIGGNTVYCSYEHHVFSTHDMIHFARHGESFRSTAPNSGVPWADLPLYAPDCIEYQGQYYLFFCLSDGSEGVATSDTPAGPFRNAVKVAGASGDGIDPAALVDDDGQVYYFWGQFQLRGARLLPGLSAVDPASKTNRILTEAEHGFHEGASIRKRNGIYYLVYTDISRGKATSMAYATSDSPLGPYRKRGIIIDNTGCDRETWNNHGSIAEYNGQWYVFYHRSSQASNFNRRVCVEPIHFHADGSIDEVEMTTQGVSGPAPAQQWMGAWRACLLSGQARTEQVTPTHEQGRFDEHLTRIHSGDWAAYKYLDFGAGVTGFEARAGSLAYGGEIEIRLDAPDGERVGICQVVPTGGWQKWQAFTCPVNGARGTRAVYLVFKGKPGRLFDLSGFRFF